MTVQAAKQVVAAQGISSIATTSTIKPKAKVKTEEQMFKTSSAAPELIEISKETGEIGPTKKNAEKLAERKEASNPFVKRGSNIGTDIYNNLSDFDWSTGTFLKYTVQG